MTEAVQIVGGMVAFEDGTKKAEEYAPAKKARVELKFDMAEGTDADSVLVYMTRMVMARVYDMLGADTQAGKVAPALPQMASSTVANGAGAKAEGKGKGKGKGTAPAGKAPANDKERLAAEAGLVPGATANADPADMSQFEVAAEEEDVASLTVVEPDPISDQDLNKAVQDKNKEIKNPERIRAVISSFNPDPKKQFNLAQIPQEQRRTFLEKLKELKAA